MKKLILLIIGVATLPLFALRPGDKVGNPEFRLKWIDCTPFKIGALTPEDKAVVPQLRALVFLFTRSDSSDRIMQILERTRLAYRGKLLIAAVSPDTEHDVKLFHKRHMDVRVRLVVDSERKLTPLFMAGSMLYPMAFLYDAGGNILWNGEAVDLSEAVELVLSGKSDTAKQRKTALLLDEMQQRMRTGEERPLRRLAEQIFRLDPANPSALRMRLFSLENRGDISGAWALIDQQMKAAPGKLRLYYTALDMMRRYPVLRSGLPALSDRFFESASMPGQLLSFAEALLANFPDDISALTAAHKILSGKAAFSDLPPGEKAQYHVVCSRMCYLLCNVAKAEEHGKKALEIYRSRRNAAGILQCEKMLDFYRKLQNLNSGKF